MYEIKTLNKIATCGTDIFDKAKYTVSDNAENPTAIMVRSAKMHDMEMPESLLAIARAGAGVNNIPVEKCAEQGIVVFNTPGANSNAVKELSALLWEWAVGLVKTVVWKKKAQRLRTVVHRISADSFVTSLTTEK